MSQARPTPPPIFAVTLIPFGAAIGWVTISSPFWLARDGVSLAEIGALSGASMMPHAIKFLWAPLVDIGARRRAWFVVMTALTALLTVAVACIPSPAKHLGLWMALATLQQIAGTTSAIASDGLMATTTRPEDKGKAGGWRMAGNVGGTGLLGALALWIAGRASVELAGVGLAVLILASAGAALLIHEAHPEGSAGGSRWEAGAAKVAAIAKDLWATVRAREGWTGLVICVVPVGAGALTNLFSAMALEYRASDERVALVNGLGGGLAGAAGSLLGGFIADRMNRRLAYALSGGVTALSAIAMLVSPMTPATFTWGTLAYNFANGIAFATLAAFILELVGQSVAAATKYTSFIAIANVASNYVTALDGWASDFRHLGARGSLAFDAFLTFLGILVLLVMVRLTSRREPLASSAAVA